MICNSVVDWNGILGLMSNIIANLVHLGWEPICFNLWVQPGGARWSIPNSRFNQGPLLRALQDTAGAQLWHSASLHHLGAGLQDGIEWAHTTALHRKLKSSGHHDQLAVLETVNVGGCLGPGQS